MEISHAIDIQLNPLKLIIDAVENEFKCIVNVNRDAYGVDIIWKDECIFNSKMKEFADKLLKKYPWHEYPVCLLLLC